ncbi:MAG TPA: reverse transcriptase family protein [Stellaceae bacterium]|nr:reverse transcriptase family protein [Stellaceae bacterium]
MDSRERKARELAAALLAAEWTMPALLDAAADLFGRSSWRSQRALIRDLLARLTQPYPPSPGWLAHFFLQSSRFDRIVAGGVAGIALVAEPPRFVPAPAFLDLPIPALTAPGELAEWLGVSIGQLDWYADTRRQHVHADRPALRNYWYAFLPKGSGPPRLVESPKPVLKRIQRQILREILDKVPVHESAHGFVAGRSCIGAAQAHAGEEVVISLDLRDFFLATPIARIHALFRALGYPWIVARLLTGLCTTCTPRRIFNGTDPRATLFAVPHLPQGTPTSPALANLVAFTLDRRLAGLARRVGANYTRYADDLIFSGDEALARTGGTLIAAVGTIARDEGFAVHPEKTRIMPRSQRQRVLGVVVNVHCNLDRPAYDRLKAILHNSVTHGPAGQNRDGIADFRAHLGGRVAWVESLNRPRGLKLRELFERIDWSR